MNIPAEKEQEERSRRTVIVSELIEESDDYIWLVLEETMQGAILRYVRLGDGTVAVEAAEIESARRLMKQSSKGHTPLGDFKATWATGYIPAQPTPARPITTKRATFDIDGYIIPSYIGEFTKQNVENPPLLSSFEPEEEDAYAKLLNEKREVNDSSIIAQEQILAEQRKRKDRDEEELLLAKKKKEDDEAALAVETLQRRLRLHMQNQETALEEESTEEKSRRAMERKKQEEELRIANEEKLAKLNKQKEEKAREKAKEKARKEAVKKQKAEEKRLRQEYKDYSQRVADRKKKGNYKPSPWCMEVEKEFASSFKKQLPEDVDPVAQKIREKYTYHREITSSLKMHLCTISTDAPVEHLKILTELYKFGGILQAEAYEKTVDILSKLFECSSTVKIKEASQYIQTGWKDLLSGDQLKAATTAMKDVAEKAAKREKEEAEQKQQEKAQADFYQYQNPQQFGYQYQYQQQPQQNAPQMHPAQAQTQTQAQVQYQHQQQFQQAQQPPQSTLPLPPNWVALFDAANNRHYFYNSVTRETSWEDPRV